MSVIDLDRLLREISPEAPSGAAGIEHDPAFTELEEAIKGTPAVDDSEGRIVREAKDPDWMQIQESACELLARAHDLRVCMFLTRALLRTKGLRGLAEGLGLIQGLVERHWETLYPRLDPDDDNDPIERINILDALADWEIMIAPLMRVKLCSTRVGGAVNLRVYRIASGRAAELSLTKDETNNPPILATVEGVFSECDLEELRETTEAGAASVRALNSLTALLSEKVGPSQVPDLGKLGAILKEIVTLLEAQLATRDPAAVSAGKVPQNAATSETDNMEASPLPTAGRVGAVESRKDVIRLLEQICAFYAKSEPASPVPLFLKRAMRLVEKNFMEIMQDLAPDSLHQIQVISGRTQEDQFNP